MQILHKLAKHNWTESNRYEKDYTPRSTVVFPRIMGWFNIPKPFSAIHHVKRIKEKNLMILSIDTEKHLIKSNTLL